MKILKTLATAAALMLSLQAGASDFIDTGQYEGPLLSVGVRVGINTSNMSDTEAGKSFSLDAWGTGFDAGVVADLHLRDFFSLQPGLFFESRSGSFSYFPEPLMPAPNPTEQYGHSRHTLLKVPVTFQLRMHPAEQLVWSADLGPVFNFGLGGHRWYKLPSEQAPSPEYRTNYYDEFNRFMMGMKFGTGLQIASHYYVGVHYECSLRSARKASMGGHDKAWTFTLGYDF